MTSSNSTVTIEAYSGWPETEPDSPGAGTVYLGEEAVSEGYDRTRITAHELGHILGLPDNYNGDCSILMSGHSAGTSCTNAKPGAGRGRAGRPDLRGQHRGRPGAHAQRSASSELPDRLIHQSDGTGRLTSRPAGATVSGARLSAHPLPVSGDPLSIRKVNPKLLLAAVLAVIALVAGVIALVASNGTGSAPRAAATTRPRRAAAHPRPPR